MEQKLERIVVTGGTPEEREKAVQGLQAAFGEKGYLVFVVPSAEQELRRAGVTRKTMGSAAAFAWVCLDLQLSREAVYIAAAGLSDARRTLIICNGGNMDAATLVSADDWQSLMRLTGTPVAELRDGYDAVFALPDDDAGDAPQAAPWAGHPHLRVAGQGTLEAEVAAFLGDPEPVEIERKYLIEYPDTEWLDAQEGCRAVEIEQAYLTNSSGEDVRIRKRGTKDGYIYFETVKRGGAGLSRIEIERRISPAEYEEILAGAQGEVRWIRKTRYCLVYRGQYLEIDVYPFWDTKAVLEAELLSEEQAVEIPPEIHVIKEVTGDPDYTNYALSRPEGGVQ